jgi:hypothetical protein
MVTIQDYEESTPTQQEGTQVKKTGSYLARGTAEEGTGVHIQLFDGRFDTGYKITSFVVWAVSVQDVYDQRCIGKVATSENVSTAAATFMNAKDDREIAWAGQDGSSIEGLSLGGPGLIDPNNLIIEDAWVFVRSNQNEPVNYLIEFEKYQFDSFIGAMNIAREASLE